MSFFFKEIEKLKREIGPSFIGDSNQKIFLALKGPLGSGKTTFVKEWLSGFGVNPEGIQSPSFLKVLEYKLSEEEICLHLDGYRVEDSLEWNRMGLENYSELRMWLVEWPDSFLEYLKMNDPIRNHFSLKEYWELHFTTNHELSWLRKSFF